MAFIRTALLALLAATTLSLSMPVRRSMPIRRQFTGTASPFDPISGDECGCGLDENSFAIKVPLSTVCVLPSSHSSYPASDANSTSQLDHPHIAAV
jgi:hypothetical protein